ncbi:hypothetical protein TCAP_05952 [Tolypocladium capitatum]|uniref:Uncharacterized protein n=1 Tax=Tolypocladium capitatum TaxID=45235 RepID=A0A2K3Q967_9HYPO|nr:hypothetical protein TCAP_05952 [Tolypocladium capitatum]
MEGDYADMVAVLESMPELPRAPLAPRSCLPLFLPSTPFPPLQQARLRPATNTTYRRAHGTACHGTARFSTRTTHKAAYEPRRAILGLATEPARPRHAPDAPQRQEL